MRDFHLPGRSAVYASNGMCATSHPLATKVAIQMLEAGGNAVDAAIAAAVLLGICEPQSTGIGGDCFVLLKPADQEDIVALNGSGRAPAALSADKLRKEGCETVPLNSASAVTVPGAIDAFCRLSKDWGKLGLKASLAPAIHYAETGVPVAPRAAFDWEENAKRLQGAARKYYLKDGQPLTCGQMFRAPGQAEVLRRVATEGREGFYEGEVAEDMVNSLNALGGCHTLDDFAATACDYTEPVSGQYKGYELVEHPPNGQGATAILMAKILSHFDLPDMAPFGALRAHIEAEAAKLAYDARNRFIADPTMTTRLDHMLSDETAARLAALINPKKAMPNPAALSETVHKDTVYLTVIDKDRMAVSLIYSIYYAFGSGLASDKFGINFQNRGAGFNLIKGHPNEAGGKKRPMHTIIPGMLKQNGRVVMPFGVMGGAYQPNGHVRFLTNLADFGMDPQEAIDGPRSFSDEGVMNVERGYSDTVRQELADMGHKVEIPRAALGGAQAIRIDHENGLLIGASDPRKDGCALGY
ncbi:MAG TPA: gamma-glutamyltransferase family protein [Rhodobacteraceae bacterium]|nr:gamma-glutamyltransferase family protein [Paracoccaceae bacterium]